jgi:hypothetical protein
VLFGCFLLFVSLRPLWADFRDWRRRRSRRPGRSV